jgi:hypothetical protein
MHYAMMHGFNLLMVGTIRKQKEIHMILVFGFPISFVLKERQKKFCNISLQSSFTSADVSSLCTVLYNAEHYSKN